MRPLCNLVPDYQRTIHFQMFDQRTTSDITLLINYPPKISPLVLGIYLNEYWFLDLDSNANNSSRYVFMTSVSILTVCSVLIYQLCFCSSHHRSGSITHHLKAKGEGGIIKQNRMQKLSWKREFTFGLNTHHKVRAVMDRVGERLYWE